MGRREPGSLSALLPDVPPPPFAKSLDLKHVNVWFGSGTIHNPAHYDAVGEGGRAACLCHGDIPLPRVHLLSQNENILVMLSGTKSFTLLPPGARNFLSPVMRGERALSRPSNMPGPPRLCLLSTPLPLQASTAPP